MRRAVRTVIIAGMFVWFWGGALVLGWVVRPLVVLFCAKGPPRIRAMQAVTRPGLRTFHAMTRGLGLIRREVDLPRDLPRRAVLVANHPTLVDVTAILASVPDAVCFVKPSLLRNALVGPFLRSLGHVDGGGEDLASGETLLGAALARLDEGFRVLVFPEGTRSPAGGLRRFHRGAFDLAARGRAALVPLVVTCDPPTLSKGQPIWRLPAVLVVLAVRAEPAIDAAAWTGGPRRLRDHVESGYSRLLGLPPRTRLPASAEPR